MQPIYADEPATKFGPDSQGDFQVEPVPQNVRIPHSYSVPVVKYPTLRPPAAICAAVIERNVQAVAPTSRNLNVK